MKSRRSTWPRWRQKAVLRHQHERRSEGFDRRERGCVLRLDVAVGGEGVGESAMGGFTMPTIGANAFKIFLANPFANNENRPRIVCVVVIQRCLYKK